jgi:PAS domain S-box-containing protein
MHEVELVHKEGSLSKRKSLGIGGRMALLVCAMVALTCLAGGAWTYVHLSRRLVEQELGRQRGVLEVTAAQLAAGVEALSHDAAFLADVPAVHGIVRSWENGELDPVGGIPREPWKERLASIFEAKMRLTPQYSQIRLIALDDGGREIIRVERKDRSLVVAPDEQLQQKGDRPYFQEAIRLPPGGVHLSDIELNQEWGQISKPEMRVLRAASPIHLPDRRLFGIIVINKDMRLRFDRMREILVGGYSLFLFDERGSLLMQSTPEGPYLLSVSSPRQLEDRFPEARNLLGNSDAGQAVTMDTATGRQVVATLTAWRYDPGRPSRYYGLLLTSSYDTAIAPSVAERGRVVWFGLLLLAVTVGAVLAASRKITRPLREITQAVEDFGQGKSDLALPTASGDEAGTLARAFGRMARQVGDQQAALQAEVAERRRAEDSLRESEQQLQLALDAAQAGIWILDAHANLNAWDVPLERIFGLEPNTFAGTFEAWAELVHPRDRERLKAETRRALQQKQPYQAEFLAGREGRWRNIKARAVVQRDGEGDPAKMIGVCWDITESKRAQEQIRQTAAELERKNREMEQFVYSVSHDLKSPVVTCKGFLGILNEDLRDGKIPEAMESAQRLGQATRRMDALIEDLLQLSRAGRVSGEPEPLDIAALAADLIEQMCGEYDPALLNIEIQKDMPGIVIDPTSAARLFQNLLGNAFKYGCSAPPARIEIGGHRGDSEIRYFVRDNGPGIPPQHHDKIFGVFQRLDATKEGTGIGLAIVSRIMETHGGRAWVESAPGQGATFWLGFPEHLLAGVEQPIARSIA